ncbi:MAG: serine--tRNA ligase, partial [Patescibacteria group bacterium]
DINLLRQNPDKLRQATAAKQLDPTLVDNAIELDNKWREMLVKVEALRKERNVLSKNYSPENIESAKQLKEQLKLLEQELSGLEEKLKLALRKLPNLFSEDTPIGKSEDENIVIRTWGTPRKFDFEPQDHLELGKNLGIIDTDKAAIISGARFNYLMGDAVLLQFALIQFAFSVLTDKEIISKLAKEVGNPSDKPFLPVVPPVLIKSEVMKKMDRFDPIEERYYLEKDDILLVGSAEHTLGPLLMDETINEKDLPIRFIGYSTAFRREAGAAGKDTSGIFRRHQFDKLEMETFVAPENGEAEQKLIVAIQEYLMQQLDIPYEVMLCCTADMGKQDYRHIDINSWLPSQGKYRETHTSDYMTDFQARRLNARVQKGANLEYLHMNDATAFAIGRTLIAILENYQQKDGSVKVPQVLQKWVGKDTITR